MSNRVTKKVISGEANALNRTTRLQYTDGLLDIAQGTEVNQRLRNCINVIGVRIIAEIKNRSADPLLLNLAIIASKGTSGVETQDFFRDHATERAVDFGTALSSIEFHHLPINTDKYTVLRHKRYTLMPGASGGTNIITNQGKSWMTINWWQPIRRQVRYDTSNANNPEDGNVTFVYWADKFESASGTTTSTNQFAIAYRQVVHFKEIGD